MMTDAQLAERRLTVNASEVGAIMGVCPYRTAADVWAEKMGLAAPTPETRAMEAGTRMESAVLAWAADQLGPLSAAGRILHPRIKRLAATPDAIHRASTDPVEAKTAGLFGPLSDEWGEPGTDQVPRSYACQAHAQMMCVDRKVCHLAAFLGGRGFALYRIDYSWQLADLIEDVVCHFWSHVEAETVPEDSGISAEVARHLRRVPGKVVAVAPDVLTAWREANQARLAAEKAEDSAKALLMAALGDAEGSESVAGLGAVTYFASERKSVDVDRLKFEAPDVYARFLRTTAVRTLRFKAEKAGKG